MTYHTICFDLDNTLYSHEEAFEKAIQNGYLEYVKKWNLSDVVDKKTWFTEFKKNCDRYWNLYEDQKIDQRSYRRLRYEETMKAFNLPYTNQEADEFHRRYYEVVDQFSSPYEGLEDLLTYLLENNKLKIGIITNGSIDTQYRKIKKLGLDTIIPSKHIFISDELGMSKPFSRIFDHAIHHMNAKGNYLYVGDSWKHDIIGSIEAGWDAIYLNTRNETIRTDHTPLYIGTSFSEVADWIKRNICFGKG